MRRVLIPAATTLCVLVCAAAAVALAVDGTTGPDALFGTQGNDRIEARGGDETVSGLGGVDFIDGGFGNDVLYGEGTCPISGPITSPTFVQRSPSACPIPISSAFHASDPSVVKAQNRAIGMRAKPAGTETRLRAPGTMRPRSTTQSPRRANHSSAFSSWAGEMRRNGPKRRMRGRPPERPSA